MTKIGKLFGMAVVATALTLGAQGAQAQDATSIRLTLKNNKFEPAEVRAPAGKPITITVKNMDTTPAEFESKPLRVEKIVPAGGEVTVQVRALQPGKYRFFDEFHEATTQGFLIVE